MSLREKVDALREAQAEYHERNEKLTPAEMLAERGRFTQLHKDINDVIVDGAKPCPDCGNAPWGVFHDGTPKAFEIGCLYCRDHRVREALAEDAVAQWNKGNYLPAREEGSLIMRKHDVTGKVLEEKLVKPR